MRPWQDAVAGASVVVRGRLCEGAEPLARAGEGGGGGGGKKGHSSPHVRETLQATLLIRPVGQLVLLRSHPVSCHALLPFKL